MPAGKGPKREEVNRDAREYTCVCACVCAMAPGDSPIIFLPFFVAFVIYKEVEVSLFRHRVPHFSSDGDESRWSDIEKVVFLKKTRDCKDLSFSLSLLYLLLFRNI